jgi:malate synthase
VLEHLILKINMVIVGEMPHFLPETKAIREAEWKVAPIPPDLLDRRVEITMTQHFLRSYSKLLIQTCHRCGIHAMGGMAAQIPIKNDPEANAIALAKVRADKEREAGDGHDGTWVAHPGLVPLAMEIFDKYMPTPNQIHRLLPDVHVSAEDLLRVPEGRITAKGLQGNISAALRYTESWLSGQGSVPLFHLMEDAATAEISRAQLWQWINYPNYPKGVLEDGRKITIEMFREGLARELEIIHAEVGPEQFVALKFKEAAALLDRLVCLWKRMANLMNVKFMRLVEAAFASPSAICNNQPREVLL